MSKKKLPAVVNTDQLTSTFDAAQINQVIKWIASGATEHDIAEAIAEQWPDAEAAPLIVTAMTKISESADANPDLVRAWCFEAAREVYRQAAGSGDWGAALRAIKLIRELMP